MQILYDVFPAHFVIVPPNPFIEVRNLSSNPPTKGAYYAATTRVIITETNITVAADSPDGPQIIFNETYKMFIKPAKVEQDAHVVTESGKMIAFSKDTNCGCGSRLRSWNPYRTLGSIYDPSN
jgi:hypothetical protein